MLALKRNRAPADPVAPVIYVGEDIIVTEPIALMRQLAITRTASRRRMAGCVP